MKARDTRQWIACAAAIFAASAIHCGESSDSGQLTFAVGRREVAKSAASHRAERRLYDGAPPTIPHETFSKSCIECHNAFGIEVAGVGFAPPTPHELTAGIGLASRCAQCHVYVTTDGVFAENDFAGLPQDMRHGRRLSEFSPPVMPHPAFMHENCVACHSGPAAREEIRVDHPERVRCRQCHVERVTISKFGEIRS